MKKITTPINRHLIKRLKAGDEVLFSGTIYTARDQAHARLVEALKKDKRPAFELKSAIIYYCGPTRTPPGKAIGSCGPTTSRRMDLFTPYLLKAGLKTMIGKGDRSRDVLDAIKRYKAVYLVTYAGCGALMSKYVKTARIAAYPDLGPEAIYRLEVEDFPLIVAIDSSGRNIYRKEARLR